jgi:hypothetical protein
MDQIKNTAAQLMNNEDFAAYAILGVAVVLFIILICVKLFYIDRLNSSECSFMNDVYSTPNGYIMSVNKIKDTNPLFDYYVKTAYNACSGGSYKNDVVDICNLKAVIKQGVRCLDFEIYSVDGKPVVSTSTSDSYNVKETYNSVPFSEVMSVINDHAFSAGSDGAPNATDPLFIHLRIKSNQPAIYNELVNIFDLYRRRLLGPKYSYEYRCSSKASNEVEGEAENEVESGAKRESGAKKESHCNFGGEPIHTFMNKMILVVDSTNKAYLDNERFYEFVNMTSNSAFMRAYHYYDVKNTPDMVELQNYNKRSFSIVFPDKGISPSNPNGIAAREMGCQMVAMRYQNIDNNLEENNMFFDENAKAFVLKPIKLRYQPILIEDPVPQDPSLSYADREIKGLPKGVHLTI